MTESRNRGSKITFGGEGGLGRRELVDFFAHIYCGVQSYQGLNFEYRAKMNIKIDKNFF